MARSEIYRHFECHYTYIVYTCSWPCFSLYSITNAIGMSCYLYDSKVTCTTGQKLELMPLHIRRIHFFKERQTWKWRTALVRSTLCFLLSTGLITLGDLVQEYAVGTLCSLSSSTIYPIFVAFCFSATLVTIKIKSCAYEAPTMPPKQGTHLYFHIDFCLGICTLKNFKIVVSNST